MIPSFKACATTATDITLLLAAVVVTLAILLALAQLILELLHARCMILLFLKHGPPQKAARLILWRLLKMNQDSQAQFFRLMVESGSRCSDILFSDFTASICDLQTKNGIKGSEEDQHFIKMLSDFSNIINGLRA